MKNRFGKLDFHMHSTVSDGTDTPEELLQRIKEEGIATFSLTDHDAVKAAEIIPPLLGEDLRFIPGVEFSCKDEEGKYHILGYGYDPGNGAILSVVDHGHTLRMKKAIARLEFLKTKFGFSFPDAEVEALLSLNNPGKPHIGNLMVRYGYAKTKEEAIKQYIDQIHFGSAYIRPEEAIEGILESGGIPVLAHPFYGSGNELILGNEMEQRLVRLMGMGLMGVEAFYSGFSDKMRRQMLDMAERRHLFVTAGSDYHGSNKLVKLGDTGLDETDAYPDGLLRFLETVLSA